MNKKSGLLLSTFIIIITLGIIALGIYYYFNDSQGTNSPSSKSSSLQNITANNINANWRTHTDSQHSFSIKYPVTWHLTTNNKEGVAVITSFPYDLEKKSPLPEETKITIVIKDNPQKQDAGDFYYSMPYSKSEKILKDEVINIDNNYGQKFTIEALLGKFKQVYIPYQNKMYIITSYNENKEFDKILESFKFVK